VVELCAKSSTAEEEVFAETFLLENVKQLFNISFSPLEKTIICLTDEG